ncbi:hypothetical protein CDD83_7459 [Cordyceps sp. RAO-2017]|nr:hypothetical protein CDD83_7459 [Cordyceps sp. RAO-2017]
MQIYAVMFYAYIYRIQDGISYTLCPARDLTASHHKERHKRALSSFLPCEYSRTFQDWSCLGHGSRGKEARTLYSSSRAGHVTGRATHQLAKIASPVLFEARRRQRPPGQAPSFSEDRRHHPLTLKLTEARRYVLSRQLQLTPGDDEADKRDDSCQDAKDDADDEGLIDAGAGRRSVMKWQALCRGVVIDAHRRATLGVGGIDEDQSEGDEARVQKAASEAPAQDVGTERRRLAMAAKI